LFRSFEQDHQILILLIINVVITLLNKGHALFARAFELSVIEFLKLYHNN